MKYKPRNTNTNNETQTQKYKYTNITFGRRPTAFEKGRAAAMPKGYKYQSKCKYKSKNKDVLGRWYAPSFCVHSRKFI